MKAKWLNVFVIAAMVSANFAPAAAYAPELSRAAFDNPASPKEKDNRRDPLTDNQLNLKEKAIEAKLNGKAYGKSYEVARGQYVELAREGEGTIWTVLGEFNDLTHNSLPKPDRSVNNTSIWEPDFNRDYYMNILFNNAPGANSMLNFYTEQSSNRYTVRGDVTDWVKVPGNAAGYDDDLGGEHIWGFLADSVNGWYNQQIAANKSVEEINSSLSNFDQWDRYDYDGDGNFNEPDGYIDTFQSVHAGEGNESGGGVLGNSAIWSHSWYANYNLIGYTGPSFNKLGGIRIGNSNYWIGKYTVQPENGGVGVFAHEYAHDIGLPDLYDTVGGENGTGFWTLMSSGSWLDDGKVSIGNKPNHMGAWEKFQLGWLNYDVARAGQKSTHRLGPVEYNSKQSQALFVILPKKNVVTDLGAPFNGSYFYYSGSGDDLDTLMYKQFNVPEESSFTAKVKFDIELDWDYAYLVYSTDNGATWKNLSTNLSTNTNPNGQNFGYGITGTSAGWVDLTASIPSGNVMLGFRYWTDSAVSQTGFMVDDINIKGLASDGAETDTGWTLSPAADKGFHVTTGYESKLFNHYYVAENKTYKGYDSTLQVGPYNFGCLNNPALTNFVDHFPYQNGLLINYWDTSRKDNNTSEHPGSGLILPIDAHYTSLTRVDGKIWRNRVQTFDSTFTLEPTDAINNLRVNSVLSPIPSQPAVSVFDDRICYYDPANPTGSVMNPNTGTQIKITSISSLDSFMQLQVIPAK